jgi:hypothetical protein
VTRGIPPVLTADEPVDPEAEVDAVAAVVAVALAVAGVAPDPAVIVTAIRGRSLEKVEELTPGKFAAAPLAVSVHTAVVVPPTEQLTVQ